MKLHRIKNQICNKNNRVTFKKNNAIVVDKKNPTTEKLGYALTAGLAISAIALYQIKKGFSNSTVGLVSDTQNIIKQSIIKEISEITGNAFEKVEKIKKIFLKEMGYSSDILKLEKYSFASPDLQNPTSAVAGFNLYSGKLCVDEKNIKHLSNGKLAATIRHELDHFEKDAKLCKAIGVDNFAKLICLEEYDWRNFNKDFWQRASEIVDIEGFDCEKYFSAILKHLNGSLNDFSEYAKFADFVNYKTNEFEKSAYNIENLVLNAFKLKPENDAKDFLIPIFKKLDSNLDEAVKLYPNYQITKTMLFDGLLDKAILDADIVVKNAYDKALRNPENKKLFNEYVKLLSDAKIKLGLTGLIPNEKYTSLIFDKISEFSKQKLSNDELFKIFKIREFTLSYYATNFQNNFANHLLFKHKSDFLDFLTKSNY